MCASQKAMHGENQSDQQLLFGGRHPSAYVSATSPSAASPSCFGEPLMSMTLQAARSSWRTPAFVVGCGCVIALISFGPRSAVGQFLTPLSVSGNWGRDVFSLAIAIQNLLWGVGQPFAGAIADRFGAVRVICGGALLYALGLVIMSQATTPAALHLGAGVLIGFGLSGCSFNLVLGAFGKLLPESWRP